MFTCSNRGKMDRCAMPERHKVSPDDVQRDMNVGTMDALLTVRLGASGLPERELLWRHPQSLRRNFSNGTA